MLFKRELKRNLKSLLIVCIMCAALVMYVISIAPSFGKDIQQLLDLKLPMQVQSAFGMKNLDFGTPIGFYGLIFPYIYLIISIYISGIFASIVLKEFSDKTAEYLFSLPAKRMKIISTKLSVAFLYSILTVVIIFLISILSFSLFIKEDYEFLPVLLMSVSWFLGGITFGSIAFLASTFFSKTRSATGIATGIVLMMYLLQVVISLNNDLEKLKYFSPFDWFKGSDIANTSEISATYCIIAVVVSVVCIAVGAIRFRKKDVLI
ncbi:MAG: ABC transporter permease subunit [Bacteroidota bacterium]